MKRNYTVWYTSPGVYVPRQVASGWWVWELWTKAEPPIAGVYIASREAAYRLENS